MSDDFAALMTEMEEVVTDTASGDGKMTCPDCAKRVTVTKAGTPRKHTCTTAGGVAAEATTSVRKPTARRSRGKAELPASVRRLGVAVTAAGVEWSADRVVTNATGQPTPIIDVASGAKLTDLPDADVMIGPFIALLWPSLPPAVQSTLARFSDHEDVIAALFMWAEYGQQIKRYVDTMEATTKKDTAHVNVQPIGTTPINYSDGGTFTGSTWESFTDAGQTI